MTPRKAPDAHGGGFFASKSAVSVANCPATVAFSDGVAVAACTSSVNLDAFSALATGSTISLASNSLLAGLSIIIPVP